MNKTVWLDWDHYPVKIGFCPSKIAYQREVRRFGCDDLTYPNTRGMTSSFTAVETNAYMILVTVHDDATKACPVSVIGTLVHEAVHVWQRIQERIGQKDRAGNEIEAYAIQAISEWLIRAYADTRLISS